MSAARRVIDYGLIAVNCWAAADGPIHWMRAVNLFWAIALMIQVERK